MLDLTEGFENWRRIDAFEGLKKLLIYPCSTAKLPTWPLRNLKELHMMDARLELDPSDFERVRKAIERHSLAADEMDDEEFDFWTSVVPAVTIDGWNEKG